MPTEVDVLVLSPHLDDAALSCGGALHRLATEQGKNVVVVNVFTADAPPEAELSTAARDLHAVWRRAGGFDGAVMAHRRGEEKAACRRLGVEVCFLDLLDALYRRNDAGRSLYEPVQRVMGARHPDDEALLDDLESRFRRPPQDALWLLPMGVGHHVDHLLVRQAAERLTGPRRFYYEDYPYARSFRQRFKARWRAGIREGLRWRDELRPLRDEDLQAKVDAIACHRSQLDGVFEDLEDMARQISRFSQGGERWWRRQG